MKSNNFLFVFLILFLFILCVPSRTTPYPHQENSSTSQTANNIQNNSNQSSFVYEENITDQTQQKSDNDYAKRQNDGFKAWAVGDKIAAIAILAAFLQILALVITIWVMRVSSKRQLRAYVFPDDAGLMDGTMLKPPQAIHINEPGVALIIRNSGQTPAYWVRSWAKIEVIEPINETHLIVPELPKASSINNIGPSGKISKAMWFGRSLTTNEIEDIEKGVRAVYLYGRIEYKDAFKKKRITNFRLYYYGKFPLSTGMNFIFCEKGNEAN